jgi:hypothetical protein
VQLPKDMAKYRDLEPFMIVLEDALLDVGSVKGAPTGVACVAAMNHLKRLWEQTNKKPGAARLEQRYRKLFLYFLDRAEPTIGKLRLKHLSVLLNALISQRWMDGDRRRYSSNLCHAAVQEVLQEITAATVGAAASEMRQALSAPARQDWLPEPPAFSSPLPDGARTKTRFPLPGFSSGYSAEQGERSTEEGLSMDYSRTPSADTPRRPRKVPNYVKASFGRPTILDAVRASYNSSTPFSPTPDSPKPNAPKPWASGRSRGSERGVEREGGWPGGQGGVDGGFVGSQGRVQESESAIGGPYMGQSYLPGPRDFGGGGFGGGRDAEDFVKAAIREEHGINEGTLAILCNALARSGFRHEASWQSLSLLIINNFRGPELRTQNLALIVNAYARLGRNDTGLLRHLAFELTSVPQVAFVGPPGARDLSNLLNSFARLGFRDVAMLVHLTAAARRLSKTRCTFGAQAIGNIMNAAVRLDFVQEDLTLDMAEAALCVAPAAFDTQAISVILNALSKAATSTPPVLVPAAVIAHLELAMGAMKPQDWTAQAVGISVNALANLRYGHGSALRLLRDAALTLDSSHMDPQALANIVNAFARPHVLELVDTQPLFEHMAAQALEMRQDDFTTQAAALVARAFARPNVASAVGGRAERVIDQMAVLAQAQILKRTLSNDFQLPRP